MDGYLKVVLVLSIFFTVKNVQASSHDYQLVVRNASSTHIFIELINASHVDHFNIRMDGCDGSHKRVFTSNDITKNYYNLTNLHVDTVYIVDINITLKNGSTVKERLSFKPPSDSLPTKVSNFQITKVTSNSISVKWDPVDHVLVYEPTIQPGSSENIDSIFHSYTYNNLRPDRLFFLRLVAKFNGSSPSIYSDSIAVRTLKNDNETRNIMILNVYDDSFDVYWNRANNLGDIIYTITGDNLKSTYSTDHHYQTIEVADKAIGSANFTIGSVTRHVKLSTKKRPTIKNLWAPRATKDSLHVMWDMFPDAKFYTLKYWEVGNATTTEIPDISGNSQLISSLKANTEYKFEVRTTVDFSRISSEPTTFTTEKETPDSVINIMQIDSFSNSVTLVWSHSVIGTPTYEVQDAVGSGTAQRTSENMLKIENLPSGNIVINVKLTKVNGTALTTPRTGTLSTTLLGTFIQFVAGDVSSEAVTVKWTKIRDIQNYKVYYHVSSTSASTANSTSVTGTSLTIYNLQNGTQYSVWVAIDDGSNDPIKSGTLTLTTLASDPNSMGSLMLENKYLRSFDLKWEPYPHATYGVKCTILGDNGDEYHITYATISLGDNENRNFDCYVFVRNIRGVAVNPAESIKSATLSITLPSEGSGSKRPTIQAWVNRKSSSFVILDWTPIDKQVTYKIDQDCCGILSSYTTFHHPLNGFNRYIARSQSPSDPSISLTDAAQCKFKVHVATMDNDDFYFEYQSDDVVVDFNSELVLVPDTTNDGTGDGGGDSDSSAVSLQTSFALAIIILASYFL